MARPFVQFVFWNLLTNLTLKLTTFERTVCKGVRWDSASTDSCLFQVSHSITSSGSEKYIYIYIFLLVVEALVPRIYTILLSFSLACLSVWKVCVSFLSKIWVQPFEVQFNCPKLVKRRFCFSGHCWSIAVGLCHFLKNWVRICIPAYSAVSAVTCRTRGKLKESYPCILFQYMMSSQLSSGEALRISVVQRAKIEVLDVL